MKTGNFIAVDFETATNDREPCQLGIVVVNNWDIVQKMSYLIQPKDNKYDINSTNVHGISEVHTKNAPAFPEVWSEVKPYFDKYDVIAHNADSFDADVLFKAVEKYNLEHSECVFTCTFRMSGLGLEESCNLYDIPIINHHDAMFDAEACAKLFIKMMNNGIIAPPISPNPTKKRGYSKQYNAKSKEDFENFEIELIGLDIKECEHFKGKRFLTTGTFERNRDYLKATIKALGGINSPAVNKSLDYAVLGLSPGPSKSEKIDQFINEGLPIKKVDENYLVEMIENSLKEQGVDTEEISFY